MFTHNVLHFTGTFIYPVSALCDIFLQIKLCDKRLLAIKPPNIVSRQTRSLSDYIHLKGTCKCMYMNMYSIGLLQGVIKLVSTYVFLAGLWVCSVLTN